jgi:4-hydroxybenzoate polyprenyltransferase
VTNVTNSVEISPPTSTQALLRLMRPRQWVKNAFVLAPLLFSGQLLVPDSVFRAVGALIAFCALASSVYVFNDIVDVDGDRAHPTKRNRPIAAGLVSIGQARVTAVVLGISGLALAFILDGTLGLIALSYLVLNVAYSLRLKHMVLLDVFSISIFFVLRLVAGSVAIHVQASVWLILCGGLLALFLGFAKRRHELVLLGAASASHRGVLARYSTPFLDQVSSIILAVTIVCYIMYTLDSATGRIGGPMLSYSAAFVLFGVLRYLHLIHTRADGNPTEVLLTDRTLLVTSLSWAVYCAIVLYRPF